VDLLCFLALLAGLTLPLHWVVTAQFAWWASPEYFRRYGVIILRTEALDSRTEVIGHYRGAGIHRTVAFKGMEYEFDAVVSPGYRARIGENELYLDPGLLYVFDRHSPAPAMHSRCTRNGSGLMSS
jgi:hypothetical protein